MGYVFLKSLHLLSDFLFIAGFLINGACLMAVAKTGSQTWAGLAMRINMRMTSPALLGVWVFGIALSIVGNWWHDGWLMMKVLVVLFLSAVHGMQTGALKRLAKEPAASVRRLAERSFAIGLASLLVIVLLAVIKPF